MSDFSPYDLQELRYRALLWDSALIYDRGIEKLVYQDNRDIVAVCALFSGGNDSTTLLHLFKDSIDYAVHINTGIGIEQTREYVRDTCKKWKIPLIEQSPPIGSTYEELVIDQGFPGPAMHYKMYQRLKERGLDKVRSLLVENPRKERVVFLAGRRREESKRRMLAPEQGRKGSTVWISPLVNWTKLDLNEYRRRNPGIPRNEVSDNIHMSGECLCGAFAKPGELDEIGFWYPEMKTYINNLESRVFRAGHSIEKCKWGWGGKNNQACNNGCNL